MLKWTVSVLAASLCLMVAATNARAQDLTDKGYYRVADSQALSTALTTCNEPFCTHYTTDGGIVDTSDYAVGQEVYVNASNLPSGSTVGFTVVTPNGTQDKFSGTWTWNWNSGTRLVAGRGTTGVSSVRVILRHISGPLPVR